MKYAEKGTRIDDLKLILERVAGVATLFDGVPVCPSFHTTLSIALPAL